MKDQVQVVDAHRRFVGMIHQAVARRALREKRVSVVKTSPLIVALPEGETRLPSFARKTKERNVDIDNILSQGLQNAQVPRLGRNYDDLFQGDKDIWVQNVSDTICSMQFETGNGNFLPFTVPIGGAPIAISREVPKDVLAKSPEFRRWLSRTPKILRVLNDEEVFAWYANMARERNIVDLAGQPDVSRAVEIADQERQKARQSAAQTSATTYTTETGEVRFTPPRTAMELSATPSIYPNMPQPLGGGNFGPPQGFVNAPNFAPQAAEQPDMGVTQGSVAVKPRVIDLCHQASAQIPVSDRLTADQMLARLRTFEVSMTPADLQYVASNGGYNTVRRWAAAKLEGV